VKLFNRQGYLVGPGESLTFTGEEDLAVLADPVVEQG
jgi:hypothetical protein